MYCVPYTSVVESLMYDMVCIRLDIAHVVGSFENIHVKTREGTLDSCKEGLSVFAWHFILRNMVPR
jgi:hypothetical protein